MARTLSRTATVFAAILIGVVCCAVDLGAAGSLDRQYAPGNGPAKGETFAVGHPKNPETWFILAEWLSEQAITSSQPTGTRIEEWQFNPQGQLVVTLTDEFEKRVPVASATYRKR